MGALVNDRMAMLWNARGRRNEDRVAIREAERTDLQTQLDMLCVCVYINVDLVRE